MNQAHTETRFFMWLFVVAVALVIFIALPYLDAIVLGIVFAVLFQPIYRAFRKLMPRWDWLSSLITVFAAIIILLIPLIFFSLQIFKDAQGLYAKFASGGSSQVAEFIRTKLAVSAPWLNIDFGQYAKQISSAVLANIIPVFSRVTSVGATFFFAFFILYYFLKDGPKLAGAIIKASPLVPEDTEKILAKLDKMASSVIRGSLVVAVLHGFVVGLVFFLFHLPNPVLWGSVSVVAALVPVVGVALIVLPAAFSILLAGKITMAIGFVFLVLIAAGFLENVLRPRLIDRGTDVHPLLILLSVLGGIATFGPTGFLLGPLALSLLLTLLEIYPMIINKK